MKIIWRLLIFFILSITGIILFTSLPVLIFDYSILMNNTRLIDTGHMANNSFLQNSIVFQPLAYFQQIKWTLLQVIDLKHTTFYTGGLDNPLLPALKEVYPQSISFLIGGLFLSLISGITLTVLYMLLPFFLRNLLKKIILAFETLPDVFIIILVQLLVIWVFKNTGILMFNIVNVYKTKAYFMPTLAISILPTLYIIKYLILTLEVENEKTYIEFARGKGLKNIYILLIYLLKNTASQLFGQLKNIFWILLSNLLMLEIIFNIYGITRFVADYGVENPHLAAICLISIFLPFFILFSAGSFLIKRLDPR